MNSNTLLRPRNIVLGGTILLLLVALIPWRRAERSARKETPSKDRPLHTVSLPWEAEKAEPSPLYVLNTPLAVVVRIDAMEKLRWARTILSLEGQEEVRRTMAPLASIVHGPTVVAVGFNPSNLKTRWTLHGFEILAYPRLLFVARGSQISQLPQNTGEFHLRLVDEHTLVGGYRMAPPGRLIRMKVDEGRKQSIDQLLTLVGRGTLMFYHEPARPYHLDRDVSVTAVLGSVILHPDGAYARLAIRTGAPCQKVRSRIELLLSTPHRGWEFEPNLIARLTFRCVPGVVLLYLPLSSQELLRSARGLGLLKRLE